MTPATLALVFFIGALIGVVGVGLLVPLLVFLESRPVRGARVPRRGSMAASAIFA